ncbi:MAG: sugar-binding transcriptional regulator [Rhizobiales bacterium]|nr:sugar-binding transcriptional regulator [Hyphomicrobiales bacterium]OJY07550.1 MAG: sugar-binding protein [Rhizobiales bacterium 63-22]
MSEPNLPLLSSDLKVKTAWLYYVEGMTQEQIADMLNVSRVKVMRTLASCISEGVVVTKINAATARQVALERALEKRWKLDSAIVVPSPASGENLESRIGHAVAGFLDQTMQDGMTLAVGGGATLYSSLGFLQRRPLHGALVVSLVGSLPHSRWINPSVVATRIAEVYDVESYQMPAPVIVDDPALRDALWRQAEFRDLRQRAERADIAILTVGDMTESATIFRHGIVPPDLIGPLRQAGAVANILCCFIDGEGRLVDHEINRRVMAIGLDSISRIRRIVLAAGGDAKVAAIRAALAVVPASVLITDAQTAEQLLAD